MSTDPFNIGPVTIPPMALGTMYFGTHVPRGQAFACLDHAYEVDVLVARVTERAASGASGGRRFVL